ncbi:TetR family transcriptional regulator [Massilia niabensis]|uniref:TetR family transcriptional regulator n=1 Tax=Massilia niabensis TaxID=544910 RepID=A0ABW0KZH8_9BURK
MRRTKEEALETRRRILDAAIAIFEGHHWKEVSLEQVAAAAGITRGAVYWHFGGKDALFREVCQSRSSPSGPFNSVSTSARAGDPLVRLRETCKCAVVDAIGSLGLGEGSEAPATHTPAGPVGRPLLCQLTPIVRYKLPLQRLLEAAVEQKHLPASLDLEFASRFLNGIVTGLFGDWLLSPHSFNVLSHVDRALQAAFVALQSEPSVRQAG